MDKKVEEIKTKIRDQIISVFKISEASNYDKLISLNALGFAVEKIYKLIINDELKNELDGIKQGLKSIEGEAKRQRKLAETFKDNEDAYKFHTVKASYFEQVLRIIETNKNFYLANLNKTEPIKTQDCGNCYECLTS